MAIKNILLLSMAFSFACCFSQKKSSGTFIFEKDTLAYNRLDYSKFGLAHVFISMYGNEVQNSQIEPNAADCLKKNNNLYHTVYYFIAVPGNITDNRREEIFAGFVTYIEQKENIQKSVNLFLNFDRDYSGHYQKKLKDAGGKNIIKRFLRDVKPSTICKGLLFN